MSATSALRRAANKVYERAFPIYRPLYATYKTYADRAERRLLRRILLPDAVIVGVGANIGIYSQFLSGCVGETGPGSFLRTMKRRTGSATPSGGSAMLENSRDTIRPGNFATVCEKFWKKFIAHSVSARLLRFSSSADMPALSPCWPHE
jgi:hypothetical protein